MLHLTYLQQHLSYQHESYSAHTRALLACVGLPCSASAAGTIAEPRQFAIAAMKVQETSRLRLRHVRKLQSHHMGCIARYWRTFGFAKVLYWYRQYTPTDYGVFSHPSVPSWILLLPEISSRVPGVFKKGSVSQIALHQCAMNTMSLIHGSGLTFARTGPICHSCHESARDVPFTLATSQETSKPQFGLHN